MQKVLKCQFHTHAFGDPLDHINYSPKTLISRAADLGYEVLSITCHRKLLFNEELKKFASEKGILLLPGIEFEINKKHILAINAHTDIMAVDSYDKLKTYRQNHPETLIIAPHPYFPGHFSLGKNLEQNIELFDAIEISWFYLDKINYNKKAVITAKKHSKPLVSTADCHILDLLDVGYLKVKAEKNPQAIFNAIKNNEHENFTQASTIFRMSRQIIQVGWQKVTKLPKKIS